MADLDDIPFGGGMDLDTIPMGSRDLDDIPMGGDYKPPFTVTNEQAEWERQRQLPGGKRKQFDDESVGQSLKRVFAEELPKDVYELAAGAVQGAQGIVPFRAKDPNNPATGNLAGEIAQGLGRGITGFAAGTVATGSPIGGAVTVGLDKANTILTGDPETGREGLPAFTDHPWATAADIGATTLAGILPLKVPYGPAAGQFAKAIGTDVGSAAAAGAADEFRRTGGVTLAGTAMVAAPAAIIPAVSRTAGAIMRPKADVVPDITGTVTEPPVDLGKLGAGTREQRLAAAERQAELEANLLQSDRGSEVLRRQELTNEFAAANAAGDTARVAELREALEELPYEKDILIDRAEGSAVPEVPRTPVIDSMMEMGNDPRFTGADLENTRIATPPERTVTPNELPTREGQGQAPSEIVKPAQVGAASSLPRQPQRETVESDLGTPSGVMPDTNPDYIGSLNKGLFTENDVEEALLREVNDSMGGFPEERKVRTQEELRASIRKMPPITPDRVEQIRSGKGKAPSIEEVVMLKAVQKSATRQQLADPSEEGGKRLALLMAANNKASHKAGSEFALRKTELDDPDASLANYSDEGDFKSEALTYMQRLYGDDPVPLDITKQIASAETRSDAFKAVFLETRKNHSFWDTFITANYLSNPVGRVTDAASTSANILSRIISRLASEPTAFVPAVAGAYRGAKRGGGELSHVLKYGFSKGQVAAGPQAVANAKGYAYGGLKNPYNVVMRAVHGGDELFFAIAEESEKAVAAYNAAESRGLTGTARADFINDFRDNPPPEVAKEIKRKAEESIFRQLRDVPKSDKTAAQTFDTKVEQLLDWKLGKGRNSVSPARFFVRFYGTLMNFARSTLRANPAGAAYNLTKSAYRASKGREQDPELARKLTEAAIGTALLYPFYAMAKEGRITGSLPKDPKEREAMMAAKVPPNSVQIKLPWEDEPRWFPQSMFGPQAMAAFALSSAYADAEKKGNLSTKEIATTSEFLMNAGKNIINGTPMQSLNSALVVLNPDESSRWRAAWANMVAGFVPMVSAQSLYNRATDPVQRDVAGDTFFGEIGKRLQSKTIAGAAMPERITGIGTTSPRLGQYGTSEGADPVYAEAYRLGVPVPSPDKQSPIQPETEFEKENILTKGLSAEEIRNTKLSARRTGLAIGQYVQSDAYKKLPDEQKRIVLYSMLHNTDDDESLSALTRAGKLQQIGKRIQSTQAGAI